MPTFRYQTVGPATAGDAGTIDAPDRASAVRQLVQRGVTPKVVEQVSAEAAPGREHALSIPFRGGGMSRRDLANLIRELATAVDAGLPLVPALRTIGKQGRSESQREVIEALIDKVEHGASLSDAMEARGRPFDDMVISLVRAGEAAGRLGEVLNHAALLLEREVRLKSQILGALVYPAILMVMVVLAVIVIVTTVVPKVLEAAEGQITQLPWPTAVVQGVADAVTGYWWAMLLGVAALLLGWRWLYSQAGPRFAIDRAALRVPVFGPLLRDVAVARFTRTFGTLTSAGLPVLQSLRIVRSTLNNRALEHAMDDVCEQVGTGRTIAEPMEKSGHFPALLVQIISLGENTGWLDELLTNAAGVFEEKTERTLKVVTDTLPVLVIVVMAGVVGFILLAVFLPLLELQESIG